MKFNEAHTRTMLKVISWRVTITIVHLINALIATGSLMLGLQIAGVATVLNSVLFWAHERGWNWIQWNRRNSEQAAFKEGNPRALGKMVSWRVLITASNFVIPFVITGSWGSAAIFGGLATFVNMFVFWAHERAWNQVSYGKQVK